MVVTEGLRVKCLEESKTFKRCLLLGRKVMSNLVKSEVAQLCLTLCNPKDCNLPGSSVHGIFQARILEWGAIAFSRRSSQPRDCRQTLYHLSHQGSPEQPRQHIKKQRHYFANKGSSSQGYGFSSSHVWVWELDHKESWALKSWCFWTVIL